MLEIGGSLSLQGLDDLYNLEGIADVASQRAVHIGDERLHAASHALADLDHGLRKFDGFGHGLHNAPEPTLTSSRMQPEPAASFLLMIELAISGMQLTVAVTSRRA